MSSGVDRLPHSLRSAAKRVDPLVRDDNLDSLLASKDASGTSTRDSLSALYALAARLHSPRLPFHTKTIETSVKKNVTPDQIWGQLTILQRPIIRRLQEDVRKAERRYGVGAKIANNRKAAKAARRTAEGDDEEEEGSDLEALLSGEPSHDKPVRQNKKDLGELEESDLDEEIETLLKERAKRKAGKSTGNDDWRYAFGKGNEDDEDWEDSEENNREGSEGRDEEEELDDDRRVSSRNARAMQDAALDEDEDDEEAEANEEIAALKELYGEDFDATDVRLGDEEDDPDLEEDIVLDDPENEDNLYTEKDGKFWGREDMLEDTEGKFEGEDFNEDYDGAAEEMGEEGDADDAFMNDELRAALEDPNLTQLERERLKEKAWVKHLEEKRLFNANWAMGGETAASKRPKEALLDLDDLDFEHAMKAVPVITDAFTAKLEDRIKKRILDKNFDDVTKRTHMTTASDLETKKYDPAIDAQKSKLSLMDLYEKDFLEKQRRAEAGGEAETAEPLTEVEKDELRAVQMWKRLAQHLGALSNYNFTPKPVQEDLEARVRAVDKQAPAITMESVGNFASTRAQALAPQDLYRGSSRKFADVGSNELQPSERRALRRAKKDSTKEQKESRALNRKRKEAIKSVAKE
ncbi:Mpp10 protein, putative [Angomonas deanei]|uniref:Mpp10 protein, putative n=1 Tax=Angomonas deanei TaxID=59799 RepID=A0A7G2C0Q4_9TRYP|nr:Mpp10 protein, putative [Angomonas deanei]